MNKSDPLQALWLAAVLLTRLPLPHLPQDAFAGGPRAVWAYPLVGVIVGALGAGAGMLAFAAGLPAFGTAALALGVMMLATGAMHEDGLADTCDGFWGGFTPERRLEIMRDSQIGTYGVLALVIVTLAKAGAIAALLGEGWPAIIAAAALSRGMMPVAMHALPHARKDGLSHSVGQPPFASAALSVALAAAVALVCLGLIGLVALFAAALCTTAIATLAKRKIGGQTGDVLGAVQSLGETTILLICAALI